MPISAKQEIAIQELMRGSTDSEAANAAGVSRQTVNEWKNSNPEFIAAFNALRNSVNEAVVEKRKALLTKAYAQLENKLDSELSVSDLVKVIQTLEANQKQNNKLPVTVLEVQQLFEIDEIKKQTKYERDLENAKDKLLAGF